MPALLSMIASPWFWLTLVGIFAGGVWTGVDIEGSHRDSQMLVQERAYQQAYAGKVTEGNVIAQALVAEKQQLANRVADLEQENRRVKRSDLVSFNCPVQTSAQPGAAPAAGDPDVRLSPQYVRMWNARISPGVPAAAGGTAGGAEGAGFAYPEDTLDNLTENGARWAECRAQLNKIRTQQGVK